MPTARFQLQDVLNTMLNARSQLPNRSESWWIICFWSQYHFLIPFEYLFYPNHIFFHPLTDPACRFFWWKSSYPLRPTGLIMLPIFSFPSLFRSNLHSFKKPIVIYRTPFEMNSPFCQAPIFVLLDLLHLDSNCLSNSRCDRRCLRTWEIVSPVGPCQLTTIFLAEFCSLNHSKGNRNIHQKGGI